MVYASLFVAIYLGFKLIPSGWLEVLTARTSSALLGLLGLSSSCGVDDSGAYLSLVGGVRDVRVAIIRECTAIHVWGVLAGLVVPLAGADWARKALSLVSGGLLVFFMNLTRILLTVFLTAYDVPPFTWFFTSPTVETYHYPVSFAYGVAGITILILVIDRFFLPELGEFLVSVPSVLKRVK